MADDTTAEKIQKQSAVIYKLFDGYGKKALDQVASPGAVAPQSFQQEDEFQGLYYNQNNAENKLIICPPYNLRSLDRLAQENNALSPCIEAMVTNTDGTGFTLVKDKDNTTDPTTITDDDNITKMWDFFLQPWPGESFVSQRKQVRRDVHRVGNGYLEFLRTVKGDIVFSKYSDAKMMRLVKLGPPIAVKTTIRRNGVDTTVTVERRFRRYAQYVNSKAVVFFKEFGCPLDMDKETGDFARPGQRLPFAKRATEILHFMGLPDAHTPYGVPVWISQMPSVLGSRKAEEFNNGFFDNGGVPPVIIFLQGGSLGHETRKALEQKTGGKAEDVNRVQIIEVEPSGGSLDAPGASKVVVERFGSDRQKDAMFLEYDTQCEEKIRRAFRLPPIFVGAAADYSFATAFSSYTVAEAQVFRPERDDFDEVMSVKVLPEMGYDGYRMKSNPLHIKDVTLVLQGLEVAWATNRADPEDVIRTINEAIGTNIKYSATPIVAEVPPGPTSTQAGKGGVGVKNQSKPNATPVRLPKPTGSPSSTPASHG